MEAKAEAGIFFMGDEVKLEMVTENNIDRWSADECYSYIFDLQKTGIKFGLENIKKLLNGIGNPENSFESVHVAGTNGKGSTSLFISSVLKESKYKVGFYSSPHLIHFAERVRINGIPVSEKLLTESIRKLAKKIEESPERMGRPTYFEFGTALAFECFARAGVEVAVIETGMGGRLDATNVLKPILSLITNISLDHMEYLGNDLESIAKEKAGIIKDGVPLVTGEENPGLVRIFEDTCKEKGSDIFKVRDVFELAQVSSSLAGQKIVVKQKGGSNFEVSTPMLGDFQLKNARLALTALEVLRYCGYNIEKDSIISGFQKASWPGRVQVLSQKPAIIIDGAHNVEAVKALKSSAMPLIKGKKLTLVFGVLGDKDVSEMMACLFPHAEKVFISTPKIDRSAPLDEVFSNAETLFPGTELKRFETLEEAFNKAVEQAKADDGAVIVTGSLYTVGEVLEHWEKNYQR